MAVPATTWVLDRSRSKNSARLVLLALARHGETADVTVADLAAMTRLGKRTVQTAIRDLRAIDELAVDFRPGAVSRYRVLMPDWEPTPLPVLAKRPPIPIETRAAVFERDGYRCLACGRADDLTLDHVYPRSLGGADTEDNLQTLCRSCNSRKGARV